MRKNYELLLITLFSVFSYGQSVFINEIHYDNIGTDTGEFIEISGPAGTDLSGYSIELYRDTGTVYHTENLSGTITNQSNGFGTLSFAISGIQNGPADGLALIQGTTVIQLLSYEGTLTGASGTTADGITSVDIGVNESNSTTPSGNSLQLQGSGSDYTDFTWGSEIAETPGSPNNSQTLPIESYQIEGLNMHPNPTSPNYINIKSRIGTPLDIIVYDIWGKRVLDKTTIHGRLDISHLKAGVYIVKIFQNNTAVTKKLVIK